MFLEILVPQISNIYAHMVFFLDTKKRMNSGIWMRRVFPGDSFGFVCCTWGVVVQVVDEGHGRRWPRHLKLQHVQLGKVDCLEIEGCGHGSGGLGWCIQTISLHNCCSSSGSNSLEIKQLHDHILVMNLSYSISEEIRQCIKDKKYRHRSLDSGHSHLNNAPSPTYYPVTPPRLGYEIRASTQDAYPLIQGE